MSEVLKEFQKRAVQSYCNILNDPTQQYPFSLCILTARDAQQKLNFERQMAVKKMMGTIPQGLSFIVIHDRPGTIGSGTSTVYVLQDLIRTHFGTLEELCKQRILLIHCGGFSKRLPNHSTLGKLFAPLPFQIDGNMWSMLEMKLAMFSCVGQGFIRSNCGGVMITCADDICIYDHEFIVENLPVMKHQGFVAFAHPSPIHIGETHGVFVLPNDQISNNGHCICECKNFIHKPPLERMLQYGAISNDNTVFTDSSYFFFADVVKILVQFAEDNPDIHEEVDCYGDFLSPLGSNSDPSYINNRSPKSALQRQLYYLLHNVSFQVVCCVPSVFYHIGTMREYIEHLATTIESNNNSFNPFMYEIGGQRNVLCHLDMNPVPEGSNFFQTMITTSNGKPDANIRFGSGNVVENATVHFSHRHSSLRFGQTSIISSMDINEEDVISLCDKWQLSREILNVPDNVFIQTLPLTMSNNERRYMTFIIGIDDDLKSQSSSNSVLFFAYHRIKDYFGEHLDESDLWDMSLISSNKCSIWDAKMYPITNTSLESVVYALAIARLPSIHPFNLDLKHKERISFGDALLICDSSSQIDRLVNLNDSLSASDLNRLFERRVDVSKWPQVCPHVFATLKRKIATGGPSQFYEYIDSALVKHRDHLNHLETMRLKRCIAYLVRNVLLEHVPEDQRDVHQTSISKLIHESEEILKHTICSPFLVEGFDYNNLLQYQVPRILKGFSFQTAHTPYATIRLPVRINLAGGWTDTPPYCLTHGGLVLNMSLKINDSLPVQATASLFECSTYCLRFVIEDDEERIEEYVRNFSDLFHISPNDTFGMHKAVMAFTLFPNICLIPQHELNNMRKILNNLGQTFFSYLSNGPVGIELCTKVSGIPRGSGLGTSSILIVASVEALRQLLINHDPNGPVNLTTTFYESILEANDRNHFEDIVNIGLAIEQVLSTGGGWQDQIGGLIDGLKLIESKPLNQHKHLDEQEVNDNTNNNQNNTHVQQQPLRKSLSYRLDHISIHEQKQTIFNNRMLVVFTGRQRLAKGVLTNVVENHIVSIGNTNETLAELKLVTQQMSQVMRQWFSDPTEDESMLEQMGKLLSKVRDLNIELSMSTSHNMEPLFNCLAQSTYGNCMIGAGSGGYIIGILRQGKTKEEAMNHLLSHFPNVSLCMASL